MSNYEEFRYLLKNSNEFEIIGCNPYTEYVEIPSIYNGLIVSSIGDKAFYRNNKMKKVKIPSTINSIGESAFSFCRNLEVIEYEDSKSLVSIGPEAFYYCDSLKSIKIPENITRIEYETYKMCTSITDVKFNENITYIGQSAFRDCNNLLHVFFPQNCALTDIDKYAFYKCEKLMKISLPKGVNSIPQYCFAYCANLKEIEIQKGNSMNRCDEGAFIDCRNLISLVGFEQVTWFYNVLEYDVKYYNEIQRVLFEDLYKRNGYIFELSECQTFYKIKEIGINNYRADIPEMFNGLMVEEILTGACSSSVKKIIFPVSLKRVHKQAILFPDELEEININSKNLLIDDYLLIGYREWYRGYDKYNTDGDKELIIKIGNEVDEIPLNIFKKFPFRNDFPHWIYTLKIVFPNETKAIEFSKHRYFQTYNESIYFGNLNDPKTWSKLDNQVIKM